VPLDASINAGKDGISGQDFQLQSEDSPIQADEEAGSWIGSVALFCSELRAESGAAIEAGFPSSGPPLVWGEGGWRRGESRISVPQDRGPGL
jgi:hypothetical protein